MERHSVVVPADGCVDHVVLLADSYARLTGRRLVEGCKDAASLSHRVWEAPFALVSHGIEADPVFNYANMIALRLFEMSWEEFTRLPSRFSAEPENRKARAALLRRVEDHGFIDDYSGIRISATGRRFVIRDAVVWNVTDLQGRYYGQAAMFAHWSDVG